MNIKSLLPSAACLVFALSFLGQQRAEAQSKPPVFSLLIPTSSLTAASSSSSLEQRLADASGTTLYVIGFTTNFTTPPTPLPGGGFLPGNSISTPVGKQVVLVKRNGKLAGSADISGSFLKVFSVSASRVLMATNGTNILSFTPATDRLVPNGVVFSNTNTSGTTLFQTEVPQPSSKFIDAVTKSNGFVTRIERFNTSTLRP